MRNFIITVDGKSYEVGVEEVGASAPAAPKAVPVQAAAPMEKTKTVTNGTKVTSPFPGLIKSLQFANGTPVKKDQPILVLEAMKMDNDITAPCDGIVTYNVAKGSNVETDTVLAVIG